MMNEVVNVATLVIATIVVGCLIFLLAVVTSPIEYPFEF